MENEAGQGAASRRSGDSYVALGYLGFLIFAWGGNYTWVKIAMRDIGPLWFNVMRYGLAVIVLWSAFTLLNRRGTLVPKRGERLGLAMIGLLQAGAMTTMTALAMRSIESTRVVLIAYTVPIWALFWSALILREHITVASAFGAGLGLLGLFVLTGPQQMNWEASTLAGSLIALAGVLCWALGAVLYKRRKWESNFWSQVFWQLFATAIAMILLAPFLEAWRDIRFTTPMIVAGLYNAVIPILLGFFCWMQALSRIPAHAAGQIMVLAPLYGVFQSNLILGEPLSPSLLTASVLVVAGAWLTLRGTVRQT